MSTLTRQIWRNHHLQFWQSHQSIIKLFSPLNSSSPLDLAISYIEHSTYCVFFAPLSSTLHFICLSDLLSASYMVNSFLSPLTSENCLARDLSTQLCMKWILRPSLQASSDLSGMALLLLFFTISSAFPALGLFPLGFSFLLDQVHLSLLATFFISLVIISDFHLFTVYGW